MTPRLRGWMEALGDAFWLRPALVVAAGVLLGEAAVWAERAGVKASWLSEGWLYAGGEAGARALLGAVATSTVGVAGTTFSIRGGPHPGLGPDGAAAAAQLRARRGKPARARGLPGHLRLCPCAAALVLLRYVRSVEEGAFVPHLGVTGALALALLCVGTLVWFVHHVATGINVETVIQGVHEELSAAILRLTLDRPDPPPAGPPPRGVPVVLREGGYLRAVDEDALADWAVERNAVLTLLVRPGDYIYPRSSVAELSPAAEGRAAREAAADAFSLGSRQAATQDLEFAARQLVEVAVRALSPGINDPFTAMAVLDRLGAALCEVAPRHLPGGAVVRAGRAALRRRRVVDYDGLCDAMFHMIRQYAAAGSPAVLIRLLETLARGGGRNPPRTARRAAPPRGSGVGRGTRGQPRSRRPRGLGSATRRLPGRGMTPPNDSLFRSGGRFGRRRDLAAVPRGALGADGLPAKLPPASRALAPGRRGRFSSFPIAPALVQPVGFGRRLIGCGQGSRGDPAPAPAVPHLAEERPHQPEHAAPLSEPRAAPPSCGAPRRRTGGGFNSRRERPAPSSAALG